MRAILEITAPNTDGLLTTAEARSALGIADGSRDADINRLIGRISASIFRACKVATDGVHFPTLLSEEMTETFRLPCEAKGPLRLSRRRVTAIATVTEGSVELEAEAYEVDAAAGLLHRLSGGEPSCWPSGTIEVAYTAGFTVVPDDLKLAAEMWLRALWGDAYRAPGNITDPMLKVEDIPGVRRIERWVDPTKDTLLPPEVFSILVAGGYVETWVA